MKVYCKLKHCTSGWCPFPVDVQELFAADDGMYRFSLNNQEAGFSKRKELPSSLSSLVDESLRIPAGHAPPARGTLRFPTVATQIANISHRLQESEQNLQMPFYYFSWLFSQSLSLSSIFSADYLYAISIRKTGSWTQYWEVKSPGTGDLTPLITVSTCGQSTTPCMSLPIPGFLRLFMLLRPVVRNHGCTWQSHGEMFINTDLDAIPKQFNYDLLVGVGAQASVYIKSFSNTNAAWESLL